MANKGNSDETEKLADAMKQGTDSRSNPGHHTKMKSESTSESEEKQKEKTTETPSRSQTESQPPFDIQPKTEVDREKDSKPEGRKEEKTTETPSRSQTESQPPFDIQPKTEVDREKGSKTEDKKEEKTTETPSRSQTESQPPFDIQPKTEVDREKGSKTEDKKEGSSDDSFLDNASTEEHEKTTETPSRSQTKSQPPFDIQPKTEVDREKDSKPVGRKEEKTTETPSRSQTESQPPFDIQPKTEVDREKGRKPEGRKEETLWICAVVVILFAVVYAFRPSLDTTPSKPNEFNVVEVFNQEMEKLETSFQNQHPELWRRSRIHLKRHLKTKHPSEPVSLILTSGHRAEKTLDCLARCLARAFSTAVNSSVLNINGKSKASQDSDQVKLDIDRELRNAFEGEKSAAVIHRFEELPPGSTLIFYRYCDHENAAYKNVFLAFTVMLDADVEVLSTASLGRVEEMVQEHIKQKFVSSDKSAMFNQMDVDKLSGLWSRISHLILPVAAEEKIEQQGCGDCDKSF